MVKALKMGEVTSPRKNLQQGGWRGRGGGLGRREDAASLAGSGAAQASEAGRRRAGSEPQSCRGCREEGGASPSHIMMQPMAPCPWCRQPMR